MLEFAKHRSCLSFEPRPLTTTPFFSPTSAAIEDSAKPIAKDIISKYADIVPTIPNKADVNTIVLAGCSESLFNGMRRPEGSG